MILTLEELQRRPITGLAETRVVACIIDYKKIEVVALRLTRRGIFKRPIVVPWRNVQVAADHLTVQRPERAGPVAIDAARFGEIAGKDVYTERRRLLGRVTMYKIDTVTGQITTLWVRTPLVLQNLWKQVLVIGRDQIVDITPAEVIVDELIVRSALKPATLADLAVHEPEAA